jgi:hypothetical protein
LEHFDQYLRRPEINRDIESAPVAERNSYYVIALLFGSGSMEVTLFVDAMFPPSS